MSINHYSKSAMFCLVISKFTNQITPLFETNKLKSREVKELDQHPSGTTKKQNPSSLDPCSIRSF